MPRTHAKPKTTPSKGIAPSRNSPVRTAALTSDELAGLEATVDNWIESLSSAQLAQLAVLMLVEKPAIFDLDQQRISARQYPTVRRDYYDKSLRDMLDERNFKTGFYWPYDRSAVQISRRELEAITRDLVALLNKGIREYGTPFLFRLNQRLDAKRARSERGKAIPSLDAIKRDSTKEYFSEDLYELSVKRHNDRAAQLKDTPSAAPEGLVLETEPSVREEPLPIAPPTRKSRPDRSGDFRSVQGFVEVPMHEAFIELVGRNASSVIKAMVSQYVYANVSPKRAKEIRAAIEEIEKRAAERKRRPKQATIESVVRGIGLRKLTR